MKSTKNSSSVKRSSRNRSLKMSRYDIILYIVIAILIVFLIYICYKMFNKERFHNPEDCECNTTTTVAANTYTPVPIKTPGKLMVFYGWPSGFNYPNNSWTETKIVDDLNQYDHIILGAGLEVSSHGNHDLTKSIIQNLKNKGDTQVFGYIDLGVVNCGGQGWACTNHSMKK